MSCRFLYHVHDLHSTRTYSPHVTALYTGHQRETDSRGIRCSWNERAEKEERALDEFAAKLASLVSVSSTESDAGNTGKLGESFGPVEHGNGKRHLVGDALGALPRFDLDSFLPPSGGVGRAKEWEGGAGVTQGADVTSEPKAHDIRVREMIVGMMENSDEELMRTCCTQSAALILLACLLKRISPVRWLAFSFVGLSVDCVGEFVDPAR